MQNEPVRNAAIVKFIAGVVAMLAAKYLPALGLTDMQALEIATGAFALVCTVVAKITRGKVTPMATLKAEHPATFAAMQGRK